ncbi:Serine/threonine protein kinase [Handroanthus impetiginosus]|uniref:Receptor-like serine/threonine-protein kinase n=1 Tax=Handroanthus impetiginosus TaxID=429701 RepID=A0A2G9I5L4_9LAMI|nr:Serine/threonine protein kinase [Handroanthus impetiginosus]
MGSAAVTTFFLLCALSPFLTLSGPVSMPSISPNFTASYLQFIDNSGAFLASQKNSFQARITNSKPESRSFYFVIVHVSSKTIIWSANRNFPISESSQLRLTTGGLTLYNDTGYPLWSTPQRLPSVASLQLLESGNLVLLDAMNNTVWESFDFPTDVLVVGQKLGIGKSLVSSVSDEDLSEGSYRLVVGNYDAMLQWNGMNYWRLSMYKTAFRDTNFPVEHMVMNFTGVYLMGQNGEEVVIKVILNDSKDISSSFQIVKLDQSGVFSIVSINPLDGSKKEEFRGPSDSCRIPFICRRLGVCTNRGSCQCAPAFHVDPKMSNGDCVPTDGYLALPGPCNGSSSDKTSIKYLNLRSDLDYFSNDFMDSVSHGVNLSVCQNLCSSNCSCLGIFYSQGSGSCYMIRNYLGSILIKSSSTDRLGYIKTIEVRNPNANLGNKKSNFPVSAVVLLPSSGIIVIALIVTLIWLRGRRRRWKKIQRSKLERGNSSSSAEEMDFISIPGLPVRFDYRELAEATRDFSTQIGSGGFGTVYKGTLQDGADVAVKKITCLGSQGKKEFLTEIAVIGKIHHVNLVRLKGFCASRGQRFLVYEYMNCGSLDHTLFQSEPILEWNERFEIAVGTARGLAYLHSGCDHKIIHCDVKPENILLHDKSQVKISDFGLSKLLSPEQSSLFTTLRGTRGYLAPEWLTSSAISDKSDVYSYGMVLLELIRGKKNSSPQVQSNSSGTPSSFSSGESGHRLIYFPLFALEMHEARRYQELVDPRFMGRVRNEEVERLVRVALCCVHEEPNLRPSMSNVVGMLEGVVPVWEPRIESLNFLRFYGRRFTEASTLGERSEQNEAMLCQQPLTNTTSSYSSFSYISSQEVSGPR